MERFDFQLQLNASKIRYQTLNGREYLIAPATILIEGVLNGSKGALFYPRDEIAKDPHSWNGMPIVVGHPTRNGMHVSARDPQVLASHGIGQVYQSSFISDTRLDSELWFDVEAVRNYDKQLSDLEKILPRLESGKPIELSTGLYTQDQPAPLGSIHNGKAYAYIARNYKPDHLAILPNQLGACSVRDGCGVNVNEGKTPQPSMNVEKIDDGHTWKVTHMIPASEGGGLFKSFWNWLTSNKDKLSLTDEDRMLGADAKAQKEKGYNPPNWSVDEELWEKAKTAANKNYSEEDEGYWAVVTHIYKNMGGEIEGKKTENAFCATGEGGGVDPTCPSGTGGGKADSKDSGAGGRVLPKRYSKTDKAEVGDTVEYYSDDGRGTRGADYKPMQGKVLDVRWNDRENTYLVMLKTPHGNNFSIGQEHVKPIRASGAKEPEKKQDKEESKPDTKDVSKTWKEAADYRAGIANSPELVDQYQIKADVEKLSGGKSMSMADFVKQRNAMRDAGMLEVKDVPEEGKTYIRWLTRNAFCATGEGGGIDPSCGSSGGAASSESAGSNPKEAIVNLYNGADKLPASEAKEKAEKLVTGLKKEELSEALKSMGFTPSGSAKAMASKIVQQISELAATGEQSRTVDKMFKGNEDSSTENQDTSYTGDCDMNREQVIQYLTTNCDCWKGKEKVLANRELFTDDDLSKLKQGIDNGRQATLAANAFTKVMQAANLPQSVIQNGKAVDVLVRKVSKTLTANQTCPECGGKMVDGVCEDCGYEAEEKKPPAMNRKMTMKEMLANASPEEQSVWNTAVELERMERQRLIGLLTANAAPEKKQEAIKWLASKPLPELRMMLAIAPSQAPTGNQEQSFDSSIFMGHAQSGGNYPSQQQYVPYLGPNYVGAGGHYGPLTENEQNEILDLEASRAKMDAHRAKAV